MRALTLLLLRVSTGTLLILWGLRRAVIDQSIGTKLSEAFYNGLLSGQTIQVAIGWAEVVLGALIILGLLRSIVYPLQAIILGAGLAFIWNHILDPFGLYLFGEGERAQLLFFPSTTVFFATLALLAFREYDNLSVDAIRGR